MPSERMMMEFGGFTPAENLKELDKLKKMIEIEPDLSDDIEKIFRKKGIELPDIFKPPPVFEIPPKVSFPFDPFPEPAPPPSAPAAPTAPTAPEIDAKLQFLLSAIPIAHPGNIITSEYHNALRDAVRALASRIGLSVDPAVEYRILTFAPDFQATFDGTKENLKWEISLNSARLPARAEGGDKKVGGGMVVQLPDGAQIFQMIVRGERDIQPKSPKEFQVALHRRKFGKEKLEQKIISMDLKDIQKDNKESGYFEAKESVKLTDAEAGLDNDFIRASKVSDRKIVNNENWHYFITADWVGGAGVAGFEIHSIQLICRS